MSQGFTITNGTMMKQMETKFGFVLDTLERIKRAEEFSGETFPFDFTSAVTGKCNLGVDKSKIHRVFR